MLPRRFESAKVVRSVSLFHVVMGKIRLVSRAIKNNKTKTAEEEEVIKRMMNHKDVKYRWIHLCEPPTEFCAASCWMAVLIGGKFRWVWPTSERVMIVI